MRIWPFNWTELIWQKNCRPEWFCRRWQRFCPQSSICIKKWVMAYRPLKLDLSTILNLSQIWIMLLNTKYSIQKLALRPSISTIFILLIRQSIKCTTGLFQVWQYPMMEMQLISMDLNVNRRLNQQQLRHHLIQSKILADLSGFGDVVQSLLILFKHDEYRGNIQAYLFKVVVNFTLGVDIAEDFFEFIKVNDFPEVTFVHGKDIAFVLAYEQVLLICYWHLISQLIGLVPNSFVDLCVQKVWV